MVALSTMSLRKAFTMIELIYAIVIISISMLTLPMLMQVNANNQEGSLFQEGILITSTKISQALTFPWDQNSSPAGLGLMSMSNVLNTASGTAGMARVLVSDFRVGHFQESLRRRLTPFFNQRPASAIGADNSIANQHGTVENLGIGGQYSYKKDWIVTTTVSYVSDLPIGGTTYASQAISFDFGAPPTTATTNIKMIQITATDNSAGAAGNVVQLTSFSSNIGETEFFKRRY